GKEPVAAKAPNSKLRRAPTADHDSDGEVTKEPQHKCKATETRPLPAPEPTVDPTPQPAEPKDRRVTADERPKKKAHQEKQKPDATRSAREHLCALVKLLEAREIHTALVSAPGSIRFLLRNSTVIGLKESAFELAPKSPATSTPISSLEETASEPIANTGNRVVRVTKMMITVPNTRNLRPRK
ncbi:unnamed protein product, partial [Rhizoctonia solani]